MLCAGDPHPVEILNPRAGSGWVLLCDHAGRAVPACLGDLGVGRDDWARHIAWDIGAGGLTEALAPLLDAIAFRQAYSRLVIDCNRRPGHPTSVASESDGTVVPGNLGLGAAAVAARVAEIFEPYHAAIAGELDRRAACGRAALVVAVHSFTPVFGGVARPWQAGVLFNRDARLSRAVAAELRREGLVVGENEPYQLGDDSDYSIPVHGEARGLACIELEIRQDLIEARDGQMAWAHRLADALTIAARNCGIAT